jgi:hypothetical protein
MSRSSSRTTASIKYKGIGATTAGSPRNFVQAFLGEHTLQQVKDLHKEVQAALDDVRDTNRLMKVYTTDRIANDLIVGCFQRKSDNLGVGHFHPKGPYRPTDENRGLHQRLTIHNRHCILIGFYYSKWLEKLRFLLDSRGEDESGSSSENDSSVSSKRSQKAKAKDKNTSRHPRSPKRPKVYEDVGAPSLPPVSPTAKLSSPESRHSHRKEQFSQADYMCNQSAAYLEANKMAASSAAAPRKVTQIELLLKRAAILDERSETKLGMQDKAVFQYREERQQQYWLKGHSMSEEAFNLQYDDEQFTSVQELLEKGDNNNNNGHSSAEQDRR